MKSLYLVKVEPGANNNKYYKMLENGSTLEVQYGRIGVTGYQTASYPISQWDKKLKEKLKKGYVDQTRLVAEPTIKKEKKQYLDIENPSISSIVSRLQIMARQAIEDNYTINSKNVSQQMVIEAQLILNNLISAETVESFNKILVELFKVIPRKMSRVVDYLAKDTKNFAGIIQREQDLLDVMKGQVIEKDIIAEDEDNSPEINKTILDVMGLEFNDITNDDKDLIKENLGNISDRYYQAWKVTNLKTQKRFDDFVKNNNIKDVRLLFHGTRSENVWSIINVGLLLKPNAIITGRLYGNGIYFAPKAQKSLGYTSLSGSYWVNGNSNSGFMLLNDVAYGKPYDVYDFNNKYYDLNYDNLQKIRPNSNCLHAHAGANIGYSSLKNDEIIVYKEEQCTVKYLIELR
jgi:poly [ADP-ribose] polymerase